MGIFMETKMSSSLIEGNEKSLIGDKDFQRRSILIFFFQALPWMLFNAALVLEFFITIPFDIGDDEDDIFIFKIILLVFIGLLVILSALGAFAAVKNLSSPLTFVGVFVAYVLFAFASIGYVTVEIGERQTVYAFVVGVPFLILTLSHFIMAWCYSSHPITKVVSGIIWALAVSSPSLILIIDEARSTQDELHPRLFFEITIATVAHALMAASWCAGMQAVLPLVDMPHGHMFFYIFTGTIVWSFVFIFGITICPLIYGVRVLCLKADSPAPPEKPELRAKPKKPKEPGVQGTPSEWDAYRLNLSNYREDKQKWKKEEKEFQKNEKSLMEKYQQDRKKYEKEEKDYKNKVVAPAQATFCEYFKNTTLHIFFCRSVEATGIHYFLKRYNHGQYLIYHERKFIL
eukprot:TRINITY_DN2347_c0_g2_i1.p1 TRINITY_DN2347_c0_g2~~TRINITY_DN2347_c0_g2_i1.p1  ORF type:complete len:415 (-),score=55.29 TRINITY_DN2347_c0_g2_i1:1-1206(-)